jgi:hypothetical protein
MPFKKDFNESAYVCTGALKSDEDSLKGLI